MSFKECQDAYRNSMSNLIVEECVKSIEAGCLVEAKAGIGMYYYEPSLKTTPYFERITIALVDSGYSVNKSVTFSGWSIEGWKV